MTGTVLVAVLAVEVARSSPNAGAGIAGFALLALWIVVAVVQAARHRRRRRSARPRDEAV